MSSPSVLPRPVRLTLAALILGALAPLLDSTIVTIALHDLTEDLHTGASSVQWITTAYILVMGAAVPVTGWAQARFGARTVWITALVIFLAGSILCACAPTIGTLIAARAIQGVGAGLIFPLLQTIAVQSTGTSVPAETMGKVLATVSLPMALGPILGPVIGGVILHWLDWHWIFLVNVPLVLIALVLALLWIPSDSAETGDTRGTDAQSRPMLDIPGLLLLVPGIVGILFGLSEIAETGGVNHSSVVWSLLAGIVLTGMFVFRSLRMGDRALVDLRLLQHRNLAGATVLLTVTGAVMYSAMFLLPLYFQEVRGNGVLLAAFLMVPQGVGALLSRVIAAKAVARFGAFRAAAFAFLIVAIATIPLALADGTTNMWWLATVLFVRGLGVGALLIPPMMVAYQGIDSSDVPHATIITRTLQQVGSSFGVAVAALVMEWLSRHSDAAGTPDAMITGFHGAFWCATVLALIALPVTRMLQVSKK